MMIGRTTMMPSMMNGMGIKSPFLIMLIMMMKIEKLIKFIRWLMIIWREDGAQERIKFNEKKLNVYDLSALTSLRNSLTLNEILQNLPTKNGRTFLRLLITK
jgi:hypothetical protein